VGPLSVGSTWRATQHEVHVRARERLLQIRPLPVAKDLRVTIVLDELDAGDRGFGRDQFDLLRSNWSDPLIVNGDGRVRLLLALEPRACWNKVPRRQPTATAPSRWRASATIVNGSGNRVASPARSSSTERAPSTTSASGSTVCRERRSSNSPTDSQSTSFHRWATGSIYSRRLTE
jgi:hypothetical protein